MDSNRLSRALARLRILDLKPMLKRYGLPTSGSKNALVRRLALHAERTNLTTRMLQEAANNGAPVSTVPAPSSGYVEPATRSNPYGSTYPAPSNRQRPEASAGGLENLMHAPLLEEESASGTPFDWSFPVNNAGSNTFLTAAGMSSSSSSSSSSTNRNAAGYIIPPPRPLSLGVAQRTLDVTVERDPFHVSKGALIRAAVLDVRAGTSVTIDTSQFPWLWNPKPPPSTKVLLFAVKVGGKSFVGMTSTKGENDQTCHEWPPAVVIDVNGRSPVVVQRCVDGRTRSKAVLERPADILPLLRFSRTNVLQIRVPETEALRDDSTARFAFAVHVVHERSLEEQLEVLPAGNLADTKKLIAGSFGDDEVMLDRAMVTLTDPVGLTPIGIPVRGVKCNHVQCFDARSYLRFQRKARNARFKCFVCQKGPLLPADLVVDPWFREILLNTGPGTAHENVTKAEYFADASWKPVVEDKKPKSNQPAGNGHGSAAGSNVHSGVKRSGAPLASNRRAPAAPASEAICIISDDEG